MQKIITLASLLLLIMLKPAMAQQTAIKIAPLKLIGLDAKVQAERAVTDHISLQLEVLFEHSGSNGSTYGSITSSVNNQETSNGQIDLTGGGSNRFVLTPEVRFYASKQALKGFYLGLYPRYSHFNSSFDYTFLENGTTTPDVGGANASFNLFGVGGNMGVQWLIADHFVIDWTILGLGYMRGRVSADLTSSDFDDTDFQDLEDALFQVQDAGLMRKVSFEQNGQTVSYKGPFSIPSLRTGLLIGYAF